MAFNKAVHVFSVQQLENEWEGVLHFVQGQMSSLFLKLGYFVTLLGSKGFLK